MTEFKYRAVEFGYHHSVFQLETIVGDQPIFPKIGDLCTFNEMLNLVSNGCILTLLPCDKASKEEPTK